MFKFHLHQVVHYFDEQFCSAPILSRRYVDNYFSADQRHNDVQEEAFATLGTEEIVYATIHGVYDETELFDSKSALISALQTA